MRQAAWTPFLEQWRTQLVPISVFFGVLVVGFLLRYFVLRAWQGRVDRSGSKLGPLVISLIRTPSILWVLILALHIASDTAELTRAWRQWLATLLQILWLVSFTQFFARLASNAIAFYASHVPGTAPVNTLTQNIARLLVGMLGVLLILNILGISVTPILTALGVGGLAVALALQDTLANLFAGFYMSLARQVRIGDFIRLENSLEGYVTDISWRSTLIRTLNNNMVIVPNAKLGQAILTNYHLPEKRMAISVQVGVSYASDPDHVEATLLRIAGQAAGEVPGLLAEPAPNVRLIPGFSDSAVQFSLNCHVAEFVDQFLAQHELRKRIWKTFRQEKIEIPFPIRTLYVHNQNEP